MPRKRNLQPSYLLHKPRNCGKVRIDGQDVYIPGEHNSPESLAEYNRLVAHWLSTGTLPAEYSRRRGEISVNELLLAFVREFVMKRYEKDGKPTSERRSFAAALRPVRELYGHKMVSEFTPVALGCCREKLIEAGITRKRINQHVGRIRRAFRWGVSKGIVQTSTWQALLSLESLVYGEARKESTKVVPAVEAAVAAIQPHVTPPIWAMVQLQLWTGARPGEIRIMRTMDILANDPALPAEVAALCWVYRPNSHKTEHHEKERVILLGPEAQRILEPWLRPDEPEAFLFSPAEARAFYNAQRRAARKTPMTPSQRNRKPKENPKRRPGDRYTGRVYSRAVKLACKKAGVENWTPNQLRHTAATRLRAKYNIEIARIILGHSAASTTEIYAEEDMAKAARAMNESG